MSEHQAADELAQARAYLLAAPGPAVTNEAEARGLLAQLADEADELLTRALDDQQARPEADEIAGYRQRRAYVLVHLAKHHEEHEAAAAAAVSAWNEATADVMRAAVEARQGPARHADVVNR